MCAVSSVKQARRRCLASVVNVGSSLFGGFGGGLWTSLQMEKTHRIVSVQVNETVGSECV